MEVQLIESMAAEMYVMMLMTLNVLLRWKEISCCTARDVSHIFMWISFSRDETTKEWTLESTHIC